jgi:hypothetical protein
MDTQVPGAAGEFDPVVDGYPVDCLVAGVVLHEGRWKWMKLMDITDVVKRGEPIEVHKSDALMQQSLKHVQKAVAAWRASQ